MFCLLRLLYTFVFVKESLSIENRQPFSTQNLNPLRPLLQSTRDRFIVSLSWLSCFVAVADYGTLSSILSYLGNTFDLTRAQETHFEFRESIAMTQRTRHGAEAVIAECFGLRETEGC